MRIAIIPARAGSKRIIGKNIRQFIDRPIIQYPIAEALSSGLFDEVMVSTDDEKIAEIARRAGASIPFFRSAENSNDSATTADALREVLSFYRENGKEFTQCCCIYPTAVFANQDRLREAANMLEAHSTESVVPVVRFRSSPLRAFVKEDGEIKMRWPEFLQVRSQDLPDFFHDAGMFYFFKTDAFLSQRSLFMTCTLPMILPEASTQDIDTIEDWEIARMKYASWKSDKQ